MKERVLEIVLGVSTCATVGYCASALNGYSTFNRLLFLALISPLLVVVVGRLALKAWIWLVWQLGYVDSRE